MRAFEVCRGGGQAGGGVRVLHAEQELSVTNVVAAANVDFLDRSGSRRGGAEIQLRLHFAIGADGAGKTLTFGVGDADAQTLPREVPCREKDDDEQQACDDPDNARFDLVCFSFCHP